MNQQLDAAVVDCDPYSNEFLENPYPFYDEIREAGPVVLLEKYGVWASARYREVHEALADWQTFSSARGVGLNDPTKVKPWRPPSIILEQDPPLHTRMRKILMGVLTAAALRKLQEGIEAQAEILCDFVAGKGEIDGVQEVAEAFPLKVFGDALGLPPDGRHNMLAYSAVAFNAMGPLNEVFQRSLVDSDQIVAWTVEKCARASLTPGSFGAQIYEAVDRGEATEHEAALLMRTFMTAGVDTTVNGISNALMCFSKHPEQWALLRENPNLARSAFEEAVRLESPVQTFFRTATRDLHFAGQELHEGDRVLLFLGGANRDPRQWERADAFDIRRRAVGHVGFGHGIHGCVGQMLARMEGESLLRALSRRVKEIRPVGRPQQRLNNTLRGLSLLPLRLVADR
jgi:cytochrome P450